MGTLKSKEAAEAFLRGCLQGIPASWWADFNGRSILNILQEIDRDSIRGPRPGRLVVRLRGQLYRQRTPTHTRILATCLVCGTGPVLSWVLEKLWERGLGQLFRWHASNPEPPTSHDEFPVWETWAATVMETLWPDEEALLSTLSPAQQEFRKVVLGIEVTEVRVDGIEWRIPGLDITKGARHLQSLFTELTAGKSDAANQVITGRAHGDRTVENLAEQHTPAHGVADESIFDHGTPTQNESITYSTLTDISSRQQTPHVAVSPPARATETIVSQPTSQFSIAPMQSILSIQPSQLKTHDEQERQDVIPAKYTEKFRTGSGLVQIPASARQAYSPDIIEKTLTTIRQLELDFKGVEAQMREIESLIKNIQNEKLELKSKKVDALAWRSRVALLELENKGLPETEETMSMINARIKCLRKTQDSYRELEGVLLDKKLDLELHSRKLVRMYDEWVRDFVREGLLERIVG